MALDPKQKALVLSRQTIDAQREMVPMLLKARERIEGKILTKSRQGKFAQSKAIRNGLYREILEEYQRLNGDLNGWGERTITDIEKDWREIAVDDIKAGGGSASGVPGWTKFNKNHVQQTFARINPFNAQFIAAVTEGAGIGRVVNSELLRMADRDILMLRQTVIEAFREAALTGMTARERQKLIMARIGAKVDGGLESWRFISASGKSWRPGNYFNMVNRTVAANASRDAYNESLTSDGHDVVQLIGPDPGVNPGCTAYVGRLYSLTGATPRLPTEAELRAAKVFHPNCVHIPAFVSLRTDDGRALLEEQQGLPQPEIKSSKPKPKTSVKTDSSVKDQARKTPATP